MRFLDFLKPFQYIKKLKGFIKSELSLYNFNQPDKFMLIRVKYLTFLHKIKITQTSAYKLLIFPINYL